ncbi:hypothetical protein NC651_019685 [Populus alba x Populus x berolinensis]|nr:hypothetical protein NC651_019685 [Populus alba x Populus x berolinensis]
MGSTSTSWNVIVSNTNPPQNVPFTVFDSAMCSHCALNFVIIWLYIHALDLLDIKTPACGAMPRLSMDNKNGTPGEKGNASLPPRRGQIKVKIGEDLKTFITGWSGISREENEGAAGTFSLVYLLASYLCATSMIDFPLCFALSFFTLEYFGHPEGSLPQDHKGLPHHHAIGGRECINPF